MITIENPPPTSTCTTCNKPLTWLYSPRKHTWVAFIPLAGAVHTITPHPCTDAPRGIPTWRTPSHRTPPSAPYLAAKAALKTTPKRETTIND